MGTSTSYHPSLKGKPEWGNFSGAVTSGCNGQILTENQLNNMFGKFVGLVGGAKKAGSGGSAIMGQAGLQSVGKISSFLGSLIANGYDIEKTLEDAGIDLSSKSMVDIVNNLIEYCSGPASSIDDKAAKEATKKLLEELISKADSLEKLKEKLKETLTDEFLEDLIIKYFGYYIFEQFDITFYEKLTKEKGDKNRGKLFKQIKSFIISRLKKINKNQPLKKINWGSQKAKDLISKIFTDVLKVFESV